MTGWAEMEDLLSEERALLFEGRIDELPALAERKVALLSRMPPRRVPLEIRDLAITNAGLLEAAGRGIRSVLQRIETARRSQEIKTYDARGRVTQLAPAAKVRGTRV